MATVTAIATITDTNGNPLPDGTTLTFSYLPQNAPSGTTPTPMPSGTTAGGVATSTATITAPGVYIITVAWAGNAQYLAASQSSDPVPIELATNIVVVVTSTSFRTAPRWYGWPGGVKTYTVSVITENE